MTSTGFPVIVAATVALLAGCGASQDQVAARWAFVPNELERAEHSQFEPYFVKGVRIYFDDPTAKVVLVGRTVGGDGICGLARTARGDFAVSLGAKGVSAVKDDSPYFKGWATEYCWRFGDALGRDEWSATAHDPATWPAIVRGTYSPPPVLVEAVPEAAPLGPRIPVPSDLRATYYLIEKSSRGGIRTITTRREGPSGISFARREINCRDWTFRYTGDGDTLADAEQGVATEAFGPLMPESISTYVALYACGRR